MKSAIRIFFVAHPPMTVYALRLSYKASGYAGKPARCWKASLHHDRNSIMWATLNNEPEITQGGSKLIKTYDRGKNLDQTCIHVLCTQALSSSDTVALPV